VRTIVVRYRTKPDRADENQKLIERVFEELNERVPDGFGYASFRLEDGVSFVHVVVERSEGTISLNDIGAFREFVAGVEERCDELPVAQQATVVGSYEFFR
jgi:hypothetical protein